MLFLFFNCTLETDQYFVAVDVFLFCGSWVCIRTLNIPPTSEARSGEKEKLSLFSIIRKSCAFWETSKNKTRFTYKAEKEIARTFRFDIEWVSVTSYRSVPSRRSYYWILRFENKMKITQKYLVKSTNERANWNYSFLLHIL